MRPPAVVLAAPGTNRDLDAVFALERAGADAHVQTVADVRLSRRALREAAIVVVAGGFSYADALGSGRLFALDITTFLADELRLLRDAGRLVLGICNGFQTLVHAGLLPGDGLRAALGPNASGQFECRWVTLTAPPSACLWTAGLTEPIMAPVAHGEGRFVADDATLRHLVATNQVALSYATSDGMPAEGNYPANPNGSVADIAGVCDATGTILGLMPHPENHVIHRQHPGFLRGQRHGLALALFTNAVNQVGASV
jgi:phosphoribosylformylglycinamidine synthase I